MYPYFALARMTIPARTKKAEQKETVHGLRHASISSHPPTPLLEHSGAKEDDWKAASASDKDGGQWAKQDPNWNERPSKRHCSDEERRRQCNVEEERERNSKLSS